MSNIDTLKRLYKDYTKFYLNKILLAVIFSILVAASTSATAWLLDPAIEKIFLKKDQTLIFIIPILIIIAFSTKGISLYLAKVLMINVAEEVKKKLQLNMLSSFIKADTEYIDNRHSGKYISNLNFDVNQITGIPTIDPKLVQILGRLKYRTSYGQNVLLHSIEVAELSAMLAHELGADVSIAKKAGLLHDIGKAVDFEVQGTHPELGKNLGEKYGLSKEVIIPIATHHEDKPPTLEAVIVKVADAISGARPGARKDTYEEYLKRLEELESLAKTFSGVEKVYAIQAGRDLRVFVTPQEVDDTDAHKLAREIADRIEEELKYPGEIKVTVIRENRIIEYAR